MKSKYNTGMPIDVTILTDDERQQAFHEWAEGSEALEELLNEGYEKGLLSHSCCGGDTGKPYICYNLVNERSRKIAIAIAENLVNSDLDCQVKFARQVLWSKEIYKSYREYLSKKYPENDVEKDFSEQANVLNFNVQLNNENMEEAFKMMSKSIREVELDKIKVPQSIEDLPQKDFKKTLEELENIMAENNFNDNLKSPKDKKISSNFLENMQSQVVTSDDEFSKNVDNLQSTISNINQSRKVENDLSQTI